MVADKTLPNSLDEARDVLTVEEAGHLLRLGKAACYEALRTGRIPSVKIGRRILIPKVVVEELLAEAQVTK